VLEFAESRSWTAPPKRNAPRASTSCPDFQGNVPDRLNRKPAGTPRIVTALERTHTSNSKLTKFERRTGAAGFIRSSAVENHIAVARDFLMIHAQLLAIEPQRAR
jgi:hypothetical protein